MDATIRHDLQLSHIPKDMYRDLKRQLQFANPKWLDNHRMGRWNRGVPKVLKFYDRIGQAGLAIPRGYMRQLILMARRGDEPLQISDQRRLLPPVALAFNGHLKPFQQQAVDDMLKRDFGTLSAPTGSGKTVMALAIAAARCQPALVVVHTRELAQQWVARIGQFLDIPEDQVGLIGGGKMRLGSKVSVALVQTLYKFSDQVAPRIGHLIVDECHRAPSRTFTEAVTAFDSRYMLGLTATPFRRDKLSKLIFWHLGDVHHRIESARLVASGDILDTEVVARETEFRPYYDPVLEYSKMLSELTADDRRNRMIVDDIAAEVANDQRSGACLVLSDRKKHCQTLAGLLRYRHRIQAALLTGDLSFEERQNVVAQLSDGQVEVLVATGQLIGEGFDCPNLATLFLTTPVRFSGRVLQYVGRILRPSAGIERARIYDYIDIHVAPLKAAAIARQNIYGHPPVS